MVKNMKKLILCVFLTAAVLFIACNDPIFFAISQEEKKLDPKIPGSPTNFTVFKENLYVASGETLFIYQGTNPDHKDRGIWLETVPKPGGQIFALAATNNSLYILYEETEKRVLRQSSDGLNWIEVLNLGHNIHSIYSINNQLFIGAGTLGNFYILNFDGTTFQKLAETKNMLLNGAAYNGSYYLIAKDLITEKGGGIYIGDLKSNEMSLFGGTAIIPFVGIINIDNTILAIEERGFLYNVTSIENFSIIANLAKDGINYPATGALAVWKNEEGKRLLLVGRQDVVFTSTDSGYTYGYMELNITDGLSGGTFAEPGLSTFSTINFGGYEKYESSLRKFPVNDIIQFSKNGESRVIFAATQREGVYSFREREGTWKWNAEEAD
jgi:hypothetical protein